VRGSVRSIQFVVGAVGLTLCLTTGIAFVIERSARRIDERNTSELQAWHEKILEAIEAQDTLGYVETWGADWKAETIHRPSMTWLAFVALHEFHKETAKP
jgi:hypothetical protein